MKHTSFKLRPVAPFRLDLTVWALRRRQYNLVDRWDGRVYRRLFALDGQAVDIAVAQSGSPDEPYGGFIYLHLLLDSLAEEGFL